MIGAQVAGFPAHVIDRVLAKHLPGVLDSLERDGMTSADRVLVAETARSIRQSADWWLSVMAAADGSAAVEGGEVGASSSLIDVEEAAVLLGVKVRQARTVAQRLGEHDLAEKVSGVWLLDRTAVEVLAEARRNRRCA